MDDEELTPYEWRMALSLVFQLINEVMLDDRMARRRQTKPHQRVGTLNRWERYQRRRGIEQSSESSDS